MQYIIKVQKDTPLLVSFGTNFVATMGASPALLWQSPIWCLPGVLSYSSCQPQPAWTTIMGELQSKTSEGHEVGKAGLL